MKAYKFQFDGLALGGEMVVIAGSEKSAREAALARIATGGYKASAAKSLELDSVKDIASNKPTVVHDWNGDY